MSDEQRSREYGWASDRLNEDVQFKVADGGPPEYARTTSRAVEYVAVANGEKLLGYLWACDADDAAGWQVRPAGGDEAYNAGVLWTLRLREAKARGLTPSQALAELADHDGGADADRVVPGSRALAGSRAALKTLAGDDKPSQPSAPPVRGGR
ncbi:hypothetical protein [Kitasatospora sp. NPDC057015]|uniref:hypothetical protein n=1 Tax=Kitasatospora sp. NPDC057015 TaxID=3346001 RepID=UPI00362B4972